MTCPGGFNILHPLWVEWEREWQSTHDGSYWSQIRRESLVQPDVEQWIPCPGGGCNHEEDPLVALAP